MTRRNTAIRDRHRDILRQGQPPCWICGQPIDYTLRWTTNDDGKRIPHPMSFTADHKIPLSQGGTDTLDNKAPAHRACNRDKSDKPHADTIRRSGSLTRPRP